MQGKRIRISVGPTPNLSQEIKVNNGLHPLEFESDLVFARIVVRIRETNDGESLLNHSDQASVNESLEYFDDKSRLFSFQIELRFKRPFRGDGLLFGATLDAPFKKLPPGLNLITRFVQMIDPGLDLDLASDKPKAFSPLLCAMNVMNIRPGACCGPSESDIPVSESQEPSQESNLVDFIDMPSLDHHAVENCLGPHKFHGTDRIPEQSYILNKKQKEMSAGERKKHFLDPHLRHDFEFKPDFVYSFGTLSLSLYECGLTRCRLL